MEKATLELCLKNPMRCLQQAIDIADGTPLPSATGKRLPPHAADQLGVCLWHRLMQVKGFLMQILEEKPLCQLLIVPSNRFLSMHLIIQAAPALCRHAKG